jgi:hypothetical protein
LKFSSFLEAMPSEGGKPGKSILPAEVKPNTIRAVIANLLSELVLVAL